MKSSQEAEQSDVRVGLQGSTKQSLVNIWDPWSQGLQRAVLDQGMAFEHSILDLPDDVLAVILPDQHNAPSSAPHTPSPA